MKAVSPRTYHRLLVLETGNRTNKRRNRPYEAVFAFQNLSIPVVVLYQKTKDAEVVRTASLLLPYRAVMVTWLVGLECIVKIEDIHAGVLK